MNIRGKRKQNFILLITFLMASTVLWGCGAPQEEIMVTPKTESTQEEEESGAKVKPKGILFQNLGAEEHYVKEVADVTGNFKVCIDADVDIPDVSTIPSVAVTECKVDDAFVQKFADTFLEGATFYSQEDYLQADKQMIEDKIAELQRELDTKNYDPEKFGMAAEDDISEEEYRAIVEKAINANKEQLKQAPESISHEKVTPMISNADQYGNYYIAVKPDGSQSRLIVQDFCGYQLRLLGGKSNLSQTSDWCDFTTIQKQGLLDMTREEVQKKAGISYEEAKEIAEEKLTSLGMENFQIANWDYNLLREGDWGERTTIDNILAAGISFQFERVVQGVPVTHTVETGGELPDMGSEMDTWMYEHLDMLIDADGVENLNLYCPYVVDEEHMEFTELISFDEVMDIFENMMIVEMEGQKQVENERTYYIDHIKLGYMRIYDPMKSAEEGTLIPVWDFFGGFECTSSWDGKNEKSKNYLVGQSYMTINAITGGIIDRGLGY